MAQTGLEAALTKLVEEGRLAESDVAELLGASQRLIVYGSLVPVGSNHDVIAGLEGAWRRGWITGELVEAGWGSDMGYPALRWDPRGDRIPAHLLDSPELPGFWEQLDEFEGQEYRRILVPFFDGDGSCVVGQVYADRARPKADGP